MAKRGIASAAKAARQPGGVVPMWVYDQSGRHKVWGTRADAKLLEDQRVQPYTNESEQPEDSKSQDE